MYLWCQRRWSFSKLRSIRSRADVGGIFLYVKVSTNLRESETGGEPCPHIFLPSEELQIQKVSRLDTSPVLDCLNGCNGKDRQGLTYLPAIKLLQSSRRCRRKRKTENQTSSGRKHITNSDFLALVDTFSIPCCLSTPTLFSI